MGRLNDIHGLHEKSFKQEIVVWFFCCYLFSLISSLYYVCNVHRNRLSIKTERTSFPCVRPCLVTIKASFRSTCLTKTWWIVFTFS